MDSLASFSDRMLHVLLFKAMLHVRSYILFLLFLTQALLFSADIKPVLNSASAIVGLDRQEATLGYPVSIKAVVTYSDSLWGILFVHDATAGLYVTLGNGPYPTNTELVEIVGKTKSGSFSPIVEGTSWKHLGVGSLPNPRIISRPDVFARNVDCEWSGLDGLVRRITLLPNHLQIEMMDRGWLSKVFVPMSTNSIPGFAEDLVDSKISVFGVSVVEFDESNGFKGLKLFVPNYEGIRVLEKAPVNPFSVPLMSPLAVRSLEVTNAPLHRIHTRGIVTYVGSNGLVLQENGHGLRVKVGDGSRFKVGDAVEAVGFYNFGMFTPTLEDAVVRIAVEKMGGLTPIEVQPVAVLWGDYDSKLIQVSGSVQRMDFTVTNCNLTLHNNGVLFNVTLENTNAVSDISACKQGEHLKVIGVCSIQGGSRAAPQSFRVMLRSAGDVVRLPAVQVFSAKQMLAVVLVLLVVIGLVIMWVFSLKHAVKSATKETAQSLSLLNAALDSIADGILVVNTNGSVVKVNSEFVRMWQIPATVLDSGKDAKLLQFVLAQLKDGDAFLKKIKGLYENPKADSFDVLEFKDGRTFERYSQPQLLNGAYVGRVWSFRDITARRIMELEREKHEAQDRQLKKADSLARMAGAIAHNVNNQLASVRIFVNMAQESVSDTKNCSELLGEADNAVQMAADFGSMLLTYLGLAEGEKAVVDCAKMCRQFSIGIGSFENITLEVKLPDMGPFVEVNEEQIKQVLNNLVLNAVESMENMKGHVFLTLDSVDQKEIPKENIFPLRYQIQAKTYACVRIQDFGCGMKQDEIEQIFEPFYSTKFTGRGLGLSVVMGIVRAHRGCIAVTSELNVGSVFSIFLPVSQAKAAAL